MRRAVPAVAAFAGFIWAAVGSGGVGFAHGSSGEWVQHSRSDPVHRHEKADAKDNIRRPATLDELLERLSRSVDQQSAMGTARLVERRWMRSGSDTADLLMARALTAMQAKNNSLAVEILDRILVLEPGWAEAWNRRATAFFLEGDFSRAMVDIGVALAREPRHFGALTSLGVILEQIGDDKNALSAYRKALVVHPFFEPAKKAVERLGPKFDGVDI